MHQQVVAAVLIVLTWESCAWASPPSQGAVLFQEKGCYSCHGFAGQGGVGPTLAPHPPPFDAFLSMVRSPPLNMPPYSQAILSDQDAQRIYDFLSTVPDGRPASELPLLKEAPK